MPHKTPKHKENTKSLRATAIQGARNLFLKYMTRKTSDQDEFQDFRGQLIKEAYSPRVIGRKEPDAKPDQIMVITLRPILLYQIRRCSYNLSIHRCKFFFSKRETWMIKTRVYGCPKFKSPISGFPFNISKTILQNKIMDIGKVVYDA